MAMSTMTEPGFIALTVAAVISFGAAAPGISTEPITRSARRHSVSIASRVENTVRTLAAELVGDAAQRLRIAVDHRHGRAHAGAISAAWRAGDAAAEDHDVGRRHARHAAEQHAAAAVLLLEAAGADMRRHAAGDLRHRRQQRQRALRAGHGLVGDGDHAGGEQVLGLLADRARDADR